MKIILGQYSRLFEPEKQRRHAAGLKARFDSYSNHLSRIDLTRTLKVRVSVFFFLLANLFASIASAGEVDARFDGKWVGVEIFRLTDPGYTWKTPQRTTVIGIAQSGKVLAVLSGFVPGLYPQISPKSGGNVLIFEGGNGFEGRKYCRLKLSPDGNTFEEMGSVVVRVNVDPWYNYATAQVYGSFHRVNEVPTGIAQSATPRKSVVYAPRPEYPLEARQKHLTGSGFLILHINRETGVVTSIDIEKSIGYKILDDAAVRAFSKWRFKPGKYSIVRVPIRYTMNQSEIPEAFR